MLSLVDDPVTEEPRRLIDLPTTARILGKITTREVEKRIADGDLESVKLGRRRLVVVESVDAYVSRLREQAAATRAARTAAEPQGDAA